MRCYTKRIACRACGGVFSITSVASKFCKQRECCNKRRRDAYAAHPNRTGWIRK